MKVLEAVEQRRAVKHFDPHHEIKDEEIKDLFSKVILSPTSFNIQNWRFVVVKDLELRKQLQEAAWNQEQVTQASLLVLVCADLKAWEKEPNRYWRNAPDGVRENLVNMIGKFYQGNEQLQRDEAIRSSGIAAQTLMLAAKDMGYDSCPMIGFDPARVAELINLPKDHLIALMLPIGKAAQPARERGGQLSLDEVLFFDKF